MASYFEIRRLVLSTTDWKPVTCPIECSKIVIEQRDGSNETAVRTDKNDPDTEKRIPARAGAELSIQSPVATWLAGDVPVYVQATSGVGPVVVSFTR